ncbi:hypothetical protein GCM10011505_49790 [Tistrella bauzanensis]|uniref:DUF6916 domain-containing protein n=1 Tax=Tistrella bauzanensis TaxID=657419 RepID=A0ABQ1J9N2_9PROT|nr:hypothetical protein [Tistrella bauzanensis]GGB63259.1 hypothetical protein GCM10011505_49790 [Tistrella bauzanensis]
MTVVFRSPDQLTAADFEAVIDSLFEVPGQSPDLPLERLILRQVVRHEPARPLDRDRFSLLLHGSRTDMAIDGQIVGLVHEVLGAMRLFTVPIGRNADGTVRYQIVFS